MDQSVGGSLPMATLLILSASLTIFARLDFSDACS
jgi:hypothetical protein